ncbi:MAG: hypothetical protein ABL958_07810 [Bdellovibrionia bacterium]
MHVLFLLLFIFLAACNRPDAYPELKDPIFHDMEADYRASQRERDTLEKEKEAAKADIPNAQPQTGETKAKWNVFFAAEKKYDKAVQMEHFHKLRLETRREEARKNYLAAFQAGQDWPPPDEYKAYQTEKRLRNAPKDWNTSLKEKLAAKKAGKSSKEQSAPKSH